MKHKHCDMIKAKAEDTSLIKIFYDKIQGKWVIPDNQDEMFCATCEYFLCLPDYQKECQHWLNGGEVLSLNSYDNWFTLDSYKDSSFWSVNSVWMSDYFTVKIKRNKEKRYVLIHNGSLVNELYSSDYDIRMSYGGEYCKLQIFEIQVEV